MNSDGNKTSVLMVCLGNICRSPLAEAALRAAAEQDGLDIMVDSAGTGDWHIGHPPDARAIQAAKLYGGLDIGNLRARQVSVADFNRFDHVVALDIANLRDLRAMQPSGSKARLSLLLDHLPGHEGQSVADPYYGDEAGFETCWLEVSAAAQSLLRMLKP
jgi:protein-tyrosine phosphatase